MENVVWHLGDTSVRRALWLREGLIALKASGPEVNIRGVDGDKEFRIALGKQGVVNLGDDVTNSVSKSVSNVKKVIQNIK